MSDFNEYTRLSQEIHAPEALKNKVLLQAARQNKKHQKGHYQRPMSILRKAAIVAAVLAVTVPVTAFGVARTMSLKEHLEQGNQDPKVVEAMESLMVTSPTTKDGETQQYLASAKDDMAEYRVLEVVCDSQSLYIHTQVVPLRDDVMFIDQWVTPDGSVGDMCIPGVSEGTAQEYAASVGKELRYASLTPQFDGGIINGWGTWAETAPDGSLHLYGSGNNPSGQKAFDMTFSGFTYATDDADGVPVEERTTFAAKIQDNSSSTETVYKHFRAYDPQSPALEKDLGIVMDSLTMEKTEMGIYATFTYHLTDEVLAGLDEEVRKAQAENPDYPASEVKNQHLVSFIVVDENGEFFKTTGQHGGGQGVVDNGDGTYSYTDSIPMVDNTDNLKFKVMSYDLSKVGLYAYSR